MTASGNKVKKQRELSKKRSKWIAKEEKELKLVSDKLIKNNKKFMTDAKMQEVRKSSKNKSFSLYYALSGKKTHTK